MLALVLNLSTKNKVTSLESTLTTIICPLVYKNSVNYYKSGKSYILVYEVKDYKPEKTLVVKFKNGISISRNNKVAVKSSNSKEWNDAVQKEID